MPPKKKSSLFSEQKKPSKVVFDAEARKRFVLGERRRKDERRAIAMELKKNKERRVANASRRARKRAIMAQWDALYASVGVSNPFHNTAKLRPGASDHEQQQLDDESDGGDNDDDDGVHGNRNFGFGLDEDEEVEEQHVNRGKQLLQRRRVIEYEPRSDDDEEEENDDDDNVDQLHEEDCKLKPKKIKLQTNNKGVTVTIEPFDVNASSDRIAMEAASSSSGDESAEDHEESHSTHVAPQERKDTATKASHLKKIWGIQHLENMTQTELKKKVKAYHDARKQERKAQKVKKSKSRMRRIKSFKQLKKKKGKD